MQPLPPMVFHSANESYERYGYGTVSQINTIHGSFSLGTGQSWALAGDRLGADKAVYRGIDFRQFGAKEIHMFECRHPVLNYMFWEIEEARVYCHAHGGPFYYMKKWREDSPTWATEFRDFGAAAGNFDLPTYLVIPETGEVWVGSIGVRLSKKANRAHTFAYQPAETYREFVSGKQFVSPPN